MQHFASNGLNGIMLLPGGGGGTSARRRRRRDAAPSVPKTDRQTDFYSEKYNRKTYQKVKCYKSTLTHTLLLPVTCDRPITAAELLPGTSTPEHLSCCCCCYCCHRRRRRRRRRRTSATYASFEAHANDALGCAAGRRQLRRRNSPQQHAGHDAQDASALVVEQRRKRLREIRDNAVARGRRQRRGETKRPGV